MRAKTWKRETAVIMLAIVFGMAFMENYKMVELFVYPVMLFAMGAFGLDAVAKQITVKG